MTNGSGAMDSVFDEALTNPDAEDCLLPMGITSENVAASFNGGLRHPLFLKGRSAQKFGKFRDKIVPIQAK